MFRLFPVAFVFVGLVLTACPPSSESLPARAAVPDSRANTRFVKIRNMLSDDPDSSKRAITLYPLVKPICDDPKERKEFVETAKWSASFSDDKMRQTAVLAAETVEFVATSCARTQPDAALLLLKESEEAIPLETVRLSLAQARLLATLGRFEEAEAGARRAMDKGSVFARAMVAQIAARRSREKGVGYRKGMLDTALKAVSVEAQANWPLIELTAVLSTRVRLLSERAVWESDADAAKTWAEAEPLHRRLAGQPFIRATRERAQDILCERSLGAPDLRDCLAASHNMANLGALVASGAEPRAGHHDLKRLAALRKAGQRLTTLTSTHSALVVFRGDEAELIEWALPAQRVLRTLAKSGAKIFVVDRSHTDRAQALVQRILEQSNLSDATVIEARRETLVLPCVTAIMAKRRSPASCPLDQAMQKTLRKAPGFAVGVLVGRDLDAEVDDFKLYALPAVLLSFRISRFEKSLLAQAKSLADTFVLSHREETATP